jgi:hypothetical protein
MSLHLTLSVHSQKADEANHFLSTQKDNLDLIAQDEGFFVVDSSDLEWCDSKECRDPDYFKNYYSKRVGKASYQLRDDFSLGKETTMELLTNVIVDLSRHFDIKIDFDSSLFSKQEYWFSMRQQEAISDKGENLIFIGQHRGDYYRTYLNTKMRLSHKSYEQMYNINLTSDTKPSVPASVKQFFENNSEFYPTPEYLQHLMLSKIETRSPKKILEPQAGKGDLVNALREKFRSCQNVDTLIDAIEIDFELQSNLRGKNISVVDSDFLTFNGIELYDLIVMNPPFSNAETHLHKAMDILFSGEIVCLLNAQTIKNPYSNERKRLISRLKEVGADIEYVEGAFKNGERRTSVEVAIVHISVSRTVQKDIFNNMQEDVEDERFTVEEKGEITDFDEISNLVKRFERDRVLVHGQIMAFYKNHSKVSKYLSLNVAGYDPKEKQKDLDLTQTMSMQLNHFNAALKRKFWGNVLELEDVKRRLTADNRKKMTKQLDTFCDMEFSVSNIRTFIVNVIEMFPKLIQGAIETLFYNLTQYALNDRYGCKEYLNNIHMFNGWKTNDAYRINKKVIIPFYRDSWRGINDGLSWSQKETLSDLELVLGYFCADSDPLTCSAVVDSALKDGINRKIETKHVTISIFKKGTMHIEFKDLDLLRRFNIQACIGKNFLPDDYGKRPYSDLSDVEKKSVESFEGAKEYKVLQRNLAISTTVMSPLLERLDDKDVLPINNKEREEEVFMDECESSVENPVVDEVICGASQNTNKQPSLFDVA